MSRRGDDEFFDLTGSVEGSLARGPERDPWSVLAPRRTPDEAPPTRIGRGLVAALLALALVSGAVAGALAGRAVRSEPQAPGLPQSAVVPPQQLGGLADLVERATPSVVYLSTRLSSVAEEVGPHPNGTVTGFIVDGRGYIVTARSGVDKVSELQVALYDGRRFRGRVVRKSPDNDVAIVKIDDAVGLEAVRLARSADLRVGEPLAVLGSSLSFGGEVNVSQGVVRALHRKVVIDNLDGLIQTDAEIGAANAGGPVLDLGGRVVGLAITSRSAPETALIIGIDAIRPFIDQVVQRRTPTSSGTKVAALTPELAFGVGITYTRGVIVVDLRQGGPGEQAGLRPNDVVTAINGEAVDSEERFIRLTVSGPVEGPLSLTVLRGHEELKVPLSLVAVVE
jgi:S1-C subfamily serine protease